MLDSGRSPPAATPGVDPDGQHELDVVDCAAWTTSDSGSDGIRAFLTSTWLNESSFPIAPWESSVGSCDVGQSVWCNARDPVAHRETLHYPHVRLASGEVAIAQGPEEYAPRFDFARFAQATGWHHSTQDSAEVTQSFADKLHVAVQFSRWRADGSRIGVYHALYVVTKQGDRFGIQCRSSTAP